MRLRTGAKALIGISMFGIALAVYEMVSCPLAAVFSFAIAEFVGDERRRQEGLSTLRGLPIEKSDIVKVEASFLVMAVFLAVIVLGILILRQKHLQILGMPISPQFMGLVVFLIGIWDFLFSGVLLVLRSHRGFLL